MYLREREADNTALGKMVGKTNKKKDQSQSFFPRDVGPLNVPRRPEENDLSTSTITGHLTQAGGQSGQSNGQGAQGQHRPPADGGGGGGGGVLKWKFSFVYMKDFLQHSVRCVYIQSESAA